jgi:hypothetical protein
MNIPSLLSICLISTVSLYGAEPKRPALLGHPAASAAAPAAPLSAAELTDALIAATQDVKIDIIKNLLKQGANPLAETSSGRTAHEFAKGRPKIQEMFAKKLGVGIRELYNVDALIAATKSGDRTIIMKLLELNADPETTDSSGKSAIDYAEGKPVIQKMFADKLGRTVAALYPDALIEAIKASDRPAIMRLLEQGAEPRARRFGRSAIEWAIGKPQIQKMLADKLGTTIEKLYLDNE